MNEEEQQAEMRRVLSMGSYEVAEATRKAGNRISNFLAFLALVVAFGTVFIIEAVNHLVRVITILFGPR